MQPAKLIGVISGMKLLLSNFGEKLCTKTGILELMDDLGNAMSAGNPDTIMLGGGNPAAVPAVQALWRSRMLELLEHAPHGFDAMLGNYDPPQGRPEFINAVVKLFREKFGWNITPENVAVTNGSQSGFFCLFNMFAGEFGGGRRKHILLPIAPEYIGYADLGVLPGLFVSAKPSREELDRHLFKYKVDFKNLPLSDDTAAIAVSRPTNPTGNVLTDDELAELAALAKRRDIPLIVDNAYGPPFPNILFTPARLLPWEEHLIYAFSLSKIGLPGTRIGVFIAAPEIVRALAAANAVVSLANGNVGQVLVSRLLESGELVRVSQEKVQSFYAERVALASQAAHECFDPALPWRLHRCEGALFFWLWLQNLPISSHELYRRLKARNVLVVSGHYFFYGLDAPWQDSQECLRINYSQAPAKVRRGFEIIGEEMRRAYEQQR